MAGFLTRGKGVLWRALPLLAVVVGLGGASPAAQAVDGCRVLLCLAGNWKNIAECRSEVSQALRDVARGKAWPTCAMSGGPGNSASHQWAYAPGNCPPQYTDVFEGESAPIYSCRVTGVVRVSVNGRPWSQVWWDMSGETATEYSPEAKARLGPAIDPKFDADYAAWKKAQDDAAAAAAAKAAAADGGGV